VTVYSCLHITATTTNTICTGTNLGAIQLNVTGGTPPYNYIWSNGTHTANIDSLSAGTYRVTVSDATSGSAVALFTVGTTIPGKPTAPGTITGPNRVCPGTTNTYSVNSVANATSYNWIVPSGATIITGQGTTQLTVKFPNNFISGGVKVSASNCGGTSNASVLAISLTTVPTAPAGISGPTIVCIGDTVTYTSSIVNGATAYNWNIPSHATIISGQGNISVQVKYQAGFTTGAVSVSASNCAGHGGSHSLTIGANHAPGKPRVVNGSSKACNNSTHQYSIAAVNNATGYHWTVPAQTTITSGQGTTSISVLFSPAFTNGSILVDATNCAGNGPSNGVSVVHTVNCGANKTNEDDDAEFAQQESPAFAVSVYPNPFTDQFHLKIETTSGENITYRIYDVTGKVMQEVRSAAYDENIAFGNNFSSGMYFIQVQQGDNIKVLRIIKTM
ncbi:MAG: large protein, partial [Bacteroidota bacterium]|nr:large protein [Bacteroidota bacterium]